MRARLEADSLPRKIYMNMNVSTDDIDERDRGLRSSGTVKQKVTESFHTKRNDFEFNGDDALQIDTHYSAVP